MKDPLSGFLGSERAVAHAARMETSDALVAAQARHSRRQVIEDMRDELDRLERVIRAMGALLREAGVSDQAVQERTLELVRRRVTGETID